MYAREAGRRGWQDQAEQGFRVFFIFPFTHSHFIEAVDSLLSDGISHAHGEIEDGH